jgi:colicin import membrane protein
MTETQLLKKQGFGPKDARVNAAARWAKSEETRVRAVEAKAFEEAKAKKKKAEEEETRRREEEAKALEEANKKAEAEALKKKEEAEAKALEEAKKKEEEAEVLKKQAEAKREEAAALARRVTERRTPSGAAAPSTGTDTKTTLAAVTAQADASEPDPNAKLASPVVGEAYYKTKAAILETEQLLLFALDSRVNVLNPHRILLNLFKTLGLPKHVAQIAFTGLTDLLFDTHLSRTKLAKRLYDGVIEGACYYL